MECYFAKENKLNFTPSIVGDEIYYIYTGEPSPYTSCYISSIGLEPSKFITSIPINIAF
jgi:hypothetical protein